MRCREPWTLAGKARKYVWSPCVWENGERREGNFLAAEWLVLDFDDGNFTLADAHRRFGGHTLMIGTTKSHGREKNGRPPCDRFRLALLWEEPVYDIETYRQNVAWWARQLGADKTVDGARFYWPCREAFGYAGKTLQTRPKETARPASEQPMKPTGMLSRQTLYFLKYGSTPGHRNSDSFMSAIDMVRHGWSETEVTNAISSVVDISKNEIDSLVKSAFKNGPIAPKK